MPKRSLGAAQSEASGKRRDLGVVRTEKRIYMRLTDATSPSHGQAMPPTEFKITPISLLDELSRDALFTHLTGCEDASSVAVHLLRSTHTRAPTVA